MVIPVSSLTFLVISSDWLTAVPRYRSTFSSCDQTAGKPVIAPEPATAPARPAAPFSTARRDRLAVLFVFFDIALSSAVPHGFTTPGLARECLCRPRERKRRRRC